MSSEAGSDLRHRAPVLPPPGAPRGQDEATVRRIMADLDPRVRALLVELVPDIAPPGARPGLTWSAGPWRGSPTGAATSPLLADAATGQGVLCWEDEEAIMSNADEEHNREALLEAFTAGWQAGLAVTITHPRVFAVVEKCFDMWLHEAVDEVEVFGLPFRGRIDLPGPSGPADWPAAGPTELAGGTRTAARVAPGDAGRRHPTGAGSPIPVQRRPQEGADGDLDASGEQQRRPANALDLRRLLARGRNGPRHRDVTTHQD